MDGIPEVPNSTSKQELKLTLKRLDTNLLTHYFTAIQNNSSALQLRLALLQLELKELETPRENPIFDGAEINILQLRDCNKPKKRSKTKARKPFKASEICNNVRIFLEDFPSSSPKIEEFLDLEQSKEPVKNEVKVEVEVKIDEVKPEVNQSEPEQPRRKRGRPKRKQVLDETLDQFEAHLEDLEVKREQLVRFQLN